MAFIVSPAKHSGIYGSLCSASVCLSVYLSGSHTFLIVTHSYVSQATHAFLGMLPLCLVTDRHSGKGCTTSRVQNDLFGYTFTLQPHNSSKSTSMYNCCATNSVSIGRLTGIGPKLTSKGESDQSLCFSIMVCHLKIL